MRLREGKVPEWLVFAGFAVLFAAVSFFHEPWYDEAQAWQIAKCASLTEILLEIPHYEGHPALWHLLLLAPAKLGVPFEPGLKLTAAVPSLLAAWLLLFRAPFPRPVRLLLPFQYFVFYQYGVVSRPYGLLLLALLLTAMTFGERDRRPWRFVLCLLLLCLTSAYGLLLAGGLCLCWVWDIGREYGWRPSRLLWRDRRLHGLLLLLAAALLITAQILPAEDTFAVSLEKSLSLPLRLLYTCVLMLPDALAFSLLDGDIFLAEASFPPGEVIPALFVGLILLGALFLLLSPRNRKYFFVPYGLLAVFMAMVYVTAHHIGVGACFLLCLLWCDWREEERGAGWRALCARGWATERLRRILRGVSLAALGAFLLIPAYWTVSASVSEVQHPYFYSRDAAAFLDRHGLSDAAIFFPWRVQIPDEGEDLYELMQTDMVGTCPALTAYYGHNIIANLNGGEDRLAYITHKLLTAEENRENLKQWSRNGYPEVLFGSINLVLMFGDKYGMARYAPVYRLDAWGNSIWKAQYFGEDSYNYNYLYVRRDLLEKYGLQEIEADPALYRYAGFAAE